MSPTLDTVPVSDVIVVGAGAGGLTTALVAALQGFSVSLFEGSDQVGGTTSSSAGTLWIPGNTHGASAGMPDKLGDARAYLDALIGQDDRSAPLREAFLASAAEAIDYLEAKSDVHFRAAGLHPDYEDLPGAAATGRAIAPVDFDGRLLGPDFARIRPPPARFMVLGGMMVGKADINALLRPFESFVNLRRVTALIARHAWDRVLGRARGTRLVMGNALVARLLHSLRATSTTLHFESRLTRLLYEAGRVVGVEVRQDGRSQRYLARLGVVLCCGGVGHNKELRVALGRDPSQPMSLAATDVRGAGLQAALDIGACLSRTSPNFLWQPVSRVPERGGRESLFPHLFMDRAKPGLLAVDSSGRRFGNEGASYHHFAENLRVAQPDARSPAYLICNADFVASYGLGAIHPGTTRLQPWIRNGYITVAATLDALAGQLSLDEEALPASVAQMNEAASSGIDRLFGKGSTSVSRFNGDPSHGPNPCLAPLITGPYVALAVWPGESASSTGLATSVDGEVLAKSGAAIPGLYACGNDMASIFEGRYPGPGATLGPAMVFAYRIVRRLESLRQSNPTVAAERAVH